jgi:hypothetical protein
MIEMNGFIIFERDDEFSEDENQVKKLSKTLASLKITPDSILYLTASFVGEEATDHNFDIQIVENIAVEEPTAKYLKRGLPSTQPA